MNDKLLNEVMNAADDGYQFVHLEYNRVWDEFEPTFMWDEDEVENYYSGGGSWTYMPIGEAIDAINSGFYN